MKARRVSIALFSLFAGATVSCRAGQITDGVYTSVWGRDDVSATLTVDGDFVVLEYEDEGGTAYVEYEVEGVRCHVHP
jgi:hypothetical protein